MSFLYALAKEKPRDNHFAGKCCQVENEEFYKHLRKCLYIYINIHIYKKLQKWIYNEFMEYEIVIKDKKTYIALFFNGDATHETPFYLVEIKIVKDSDFVFLQDGGYIKT